jgi:hypothetical protein
MKPKTNSDLHLNLETLKTTSPGPRQSVRARVSQCPSSGLVLLSSDSVSVFSLSLLPLSPSVFPPTYSHGRSLLSSCLFFFFVLSHARVYACTPDTAPFLNSFHAGFLSVARISHVHSVADVRGPRRRRLHSLRGAFALLLPSAR